MAYTRKLQGEIDKCLKKVAEGVETFEEIWQKVRECLNSASSSNQKEKYEADLKKEIKKLQRHRDQIKTWIASSDIKDKSLLMENRRLIEQQMERFKAVEKEAKTKAYSKEGLTGSAKVDPKEKEKEEVRTWLISQIEELNIQSDKAEADLEALSGAKKRGKDAGKAEEYRRTLDGHKFHVQKLEAVLRFVDNDAIDLDKVKGIQEDVEYYVTNNSDPDFQENEYLYDDVITDDMLIPVPQAPASSEAGEDEMADGSESVSSAPSAPISPPGTPSSTKPGGSGQTSNHSNKQENNRKRTKSESTAQDEKSTLNQLRPNSSSAAPLVSQVGQQPPITPSKSTHPTINGSTALTESTDTALSSGDSSSIRQPIREIHGSDTAFDSVSESSELSSSHTNSSHQPGEASPASSPAVSNLPASPLPVPPALMNGPTAPMLFSAKVSQSVKPHPQQSSQQPPSQAEQSQQQPVVSSSQSFSVQQQQQQPPGQMSLKSIAAQAVQEGKSAGTLQNPPPGHLSAGVYNNLSRPVGAPSPAGSAHSSNADAASLVPPSPSKGAAQGGNSQPLSLPSQVLPTPLSQAQPSLQSGLSGGAGVATSLGSQVTSSDGGSGTTTTTSSTRTIQLSPVLGVAPLGRHPLTTEHSLQLRLLEAAHQHIPHPSDSERLRLSFPRNPCPTPSYYPQTPPPSADTLEFFYKLSAETLFFIFYYMEGTKAQFYAAKALKKQSWRFHTKYMMWFQRHEEPKSITEEYEQGTYIYFDYEKWGQRKKDAFVFEYKYLEDRDLN